MSALPPKADMCGAARDVRFGPIADIVRQRGYLVRCGLGKSLDLEATLTREGWPKAAIERCKQVNELYKAGGEEELLAETMRRIERAEESALRAVVRRRLFSRL